VKSRHPEGCEHGSRLLGCAEMQQADQNLNTASGRAENPRAGVAPGPPAIVH